MSDQTLTRSQLERNLLTTLAGGPMALREQIRAVLALSQQVTTPPAEPETPPPLSTAEARLLALTALADHLPQDQLERLHTEIQASEHLATRLLSSTALALRLSPQHFQAMIRDVWEQAQHLDSAAGRTRVLLQLIPLLTLVYDEPVAPPVLLEIVALAQAIGNVEARIRSLTALIPYLPHTMRVRVLHRVMDEIDRLYNDNQRATALCALADRLIPEVEARALRSAESIQVAFEKARVFTALAPCLPANLQGNLRHDALRVINSIADEEERAEALIAFAPHLEYITQEDEFPELLEEALTIAVGFKRRHLRARVLVALAPHLTLDLQGEALAAVHSLSSERERTALLEKLAPTLPPNMLVASLAVVHSLAEQDTRVFALTVLAHYLPDKAREQTMLDALAAASNLPHRLERVSALMDVMDVLPPHLQDQAFNSALEAARLIDNESARARALSLLSTHLPARLQGRALESARQLTNAEQRLSALSSLAPVLPEAERQPLAAELLAAVQELPFDYKRARAISEIIPLLPDDRLPAALDIARQIEDPMDRMTAYIALLPRTQDDQHTAWLQECWQLISAIDDGYDAASAIFALAPLLPASMHDQVARAAGMVIGSIMDEYDQASAIALLAPLLASKTAHTDGNALPDKYTALESALLAALDIADHSLRSALLAQAVELWIDVSEDDQRYRLWQKALQHLAAQPLPQTLLALAVLMPVVRHTAGATVVEQIVQDLSAFPNLAVAESD
jgi:hypothetical protein